MVTCFLDNHRGTSTFSVSNVALELFLEDSVGAGGWGEDRVIYEWVVARNGPEKPLTVSMLWGLPLWAALLTHWTSISINASTSSQPPGSSRSLIFKR